MKIICFSSLTSIWYSSFPEAIVAHELQKSGNEVVYITPGNEFPGKSNIINENILRKEFKLKGYNIGNVLTTKDRDEISLLMSTLDQDNFENLIIDNIKIGKIALYETLLTHKKMSINFSHGEWKRCRSEIRSTLISFYACRKILNKEKPDRILVYNSLYSVNHVWVECANNLNVPIYYLDGGANLSDFSNTLYIAKNNSIYYTECIKKIWDKVKHVPISREMGTYATNHFLELLKAKNSRVYSAPKSNAYINIRKVFGIKNNQKILIATMSSYDELFAAQFTGVWSIPTDLIFTTQADWIQSLIDYVTNKKDLFLLIRVHPREFTNKRNRLKSEHFKMLELRFKNLPNNVRINWPSDNISIYDLAQTTDVFLNAWSTVGEEMSVLGIPVVIYSKELILYPSDLNYLAKNKQDYFLQIELALKEGWSYKKMKLAYRWLVLNYDRALFRFQSVDIRLPQSIHNHSIIKLTNYIYSSLPPEIRSLISKLFFLIPGSGVGKKQKDDCVRYLANPIDISRVNNMLINLEDTLVDEKSILTSTITKTQEDNFLRSEIKRISHAMYGRSSKISKIKGRELQYNLQQISS